MQVTRPRETEEEHFTWMRRPTCCRAAEPAMPLCEVRGRSATTLSLYRWHDSVASLVLEDFIFSVLEQQKERWPGPVDNIFPHLVILCMLNCCTGHCSYINRQYWHQTQTRAVDWCDELIALTARLKTRIWSWDIYHRDTQRQQEHSGYKQCQLWAESMLKSKIDKVKLFTKSYVSQTFIYCLILKIQDSLVFKFSIVQ